MHESPVRSGWGPVPAWLCLEQFRAAADLLPEKWGINHNAGLGLSVAVNKGPALGREEGDGKRCESAINTEVRALGRNEWLFPLHAFILIGKLCTIIILKQSKAWLSCNMEWICVKDYQWNNEGACKLIQRAFWRTGLHSLPEKASEMPVPH